MVPLPLVASLPPPQVNILRELRHPFVVRYYDRIIDKVATKLYIIMEHCEGGDLCDLIRKAKRDSAPIDEEFVWKVLAQAVIALKECHRHRDAGGKVTPILHRDLKPANLFLDAAGNIKVGDFGLAKALASESKFATTNVGTPFYMSPVRLHNARGAEPACGVVAHEGSACRHRTAPRIAHHASRTMHCVSSTHRRR